MAPIRSMMQMQVSTRALLKRHRYKKHSMVLREETARESHHDPLDPYALYPSIFTYSHRCYNYTTSTTYYIIRPLKETMSGPGSIFDRNRANSISAQTQLWRAMCDTSGDTTDPLEEFFNDDAIIVETDGAMYSKKAYIKQFQPWDSYEVTNKPEFVEIDLMSGVTVTSLRITKSNSSPIRAVCTGVWRQGAGGDWRCCTYHIAATK